MLKMCSEYKTEGNCRGGFILEDIGLGKLTGTKKDFYLNDYMVHPDRTAFREIK
jgi:hypothetical protein